MPQLLSRIVDRVLVVDDDPKERSGHTWVLEDGDFEPVPENGPLDRTPVEYARRTALNGAGVQAALCDQRLGVRAGYATYLGSDIVRAWYELKFPAVLCTRYEDAAMNDIRPLRRWIPVLLSYDELHEDAANFQSACSECIYEFDVGFRPHRQPWRAQVVVADVDEERKHFWFEVPSWELSARIRVRSQDLPEEVRGRLELDFRLFAQVNLGAERNEDLFFDSWELPE
jgi:hypothetical protein